MVWGFRGLGFRVSMLVSLYFYVRIRMFLCSKYFPCACLYISMPVCFYARTYSMLASSVIGFNAHALIFLCSNIIYDCVPMFLCSYSYISMLEILSMLRS